MQAVAFVLGTSALHPVNRLEPSIAAADEAKIHILQSAFVGYGPRIGTGRSCPHS
jgi:hypothetical protein